MARYSGQLLNKSDTTGETRKKADVSLQRSGQSQFSHKEFPQLGPWHHVGATMEITLDKKIDPSSERLGAESYKFKTNI